jgi:predicted NUDIX family NTP pyrophosphohydrolase
MPRRSAGILLFRKSDRGLEVLLGHPGGPFWTRKDAGAWSIPKGEVAGSEELLDAAKREFTEETGYMVDGPFIPLQPVRQSGGKFVHAWAVEGELDPDQITSSTFELEWPPGSGRVRVFPEIDRVEWFDMDTARTKVNPAQSGFLDELESILE